MGSCCRAEGAPRPFPEGRRARERSCQRLTRADAGAGSDVVEGLGEKDGAREREEEVLGDLGRARGLAAVAEAAEPASDGEDGQGDHPEHTDDEDAAWMAGPGQTATVLEELGVGGPVGLLLASPVSSGELEGEPGRQRVRCLARDVEAVADAG